MNSSPNVLPILFNALAFTGDKASKINALVTFFLNIRSLTQFLRTKISKPYSKALRYVLLTSAVCVLYTYTRAGERQTQTTTERNKQGVLSELDELKRTVQNQAAELILLRVELEGLSKVKSNQSLSEPSKNGKGIGLKSGSSSSKDSRFKESDGWLERSMGRGKGYRSNRKVDGRSSTGKGR